MIKKNFIYSWIETKNKRTATTTTKSIIYSCFTNMPSFPLWLLVGRYSHVVTGAFSVNQIFPMSKILQKIKTKLKSLPLESGPHSYSLTHIPDICEEKLHPLSIRLSTHISNPNGCMPITLIPKWLAFNILEFFNYFPFCRHKLKNYSQSFSSMAELFTFVRMTTYLYRYKSTTNSSLPIFVPAVFKAILTSL